MNLHECSLFDDLIILLETSFESQHFVSATDFVTILYEVFITNMDILKFFFS